MDRIRVESSVVTTRLVQHLNVGCVIAVPFLYDSSDSVIFAFMLLANCFLYALHWSVATGRFRPSIAGLRGVWVLNYSLLVVGHWVGPQSHDVHSSAHIKILEAAQIVGILVFVDRQTHMDGQLLLALTEVCRHIVNRGWERTELFATIHAQVVFSGLLIIAAIVFEITLRGRVAAQFQRADAETLVSSFRTLLRGICDAELLLNDRLKIEAGTGLSRILLSEDEWEGATFQDLLSEDSEEQQRFQKFISKEDDDQQTAPATAPCLRVSFRTAQQQRVGVDLYHVQVPHLYGCADAYHLLALKIDPETIVPEAVPAQIPSVTLGTMNSTGRRPRSRASSMASSAVEGSMVRGLPHLSELMLVVDAEQRHEVVQVHVQYKENQRQEAGREGNAREVDALPTLRQFVRPTEWQTVCSHVRQVVNGGKSGNTEKFRLGKVWVRMMDDPRKYMQARESTLHFKDSGAAGQVWMHLRCFRSHEERSGRSARSARSVGRSELGDVEEHPEEA
ncbi:unnamed protein product [Symbiodinium natans]|uniref:Uncharacterized protein n=1 Tax=Symbiodinium natans TaxID=878477 RepID=A0A812L3W5_9DINO|nr:unnamed protein product [Symbiodinium natans]